MKNIGLYMTAFAAAATSLLTTSCDDDFMNEVPQTAITVPGYFNSVNDMEIYINGIYGIDGWGGRRDADSDNATGPGHNDAAGTWNVVYGFVNSNNAGGWDQWGSVRNCNVLLDNADRVPGAEADKNHWIGIARYFRAFLYIGMVQNHSDVPWIEHAMSSDDPDVYRPSDPREFVVDRIMEDLEFACQWIKPDIGNRTRVHKYCALTLLSRFALYEGTFRKYHAELNLQSTANSFLERAVSASEEIMNSGHFAIAGTSVDDAGNPDAGIKGSPAYRAIFASLDLSANKEIIRYIQFFPLENLGYNFGAINANHYSLSRSLMESYLTADGKPYSTVDGYATKPYYEGFANRDPRLAENFAHPGSSFRTPSYVAFEINPRKGGYTQEKYEANTSDRWNDRFEGAVVYRYAEVLLNYAEAKAELGQFDASAQARSINLLRTRVGMPAFDAAREVDQTLRNQYPNVSDNATLAVRRERRVELACEGFRLQDIYRWAVGERFLDPEAQQGLYIPGFGAYDSSGDGVPDYAIVQKESDVPADWKTSGVLEWFYMESPGDLPNEERGTYAATFYLSEGDHGYLTNVETNPRAFRSPKDYYRPINVTHTVLNPGIKQPFGW